MKKVLFIFHDTNMTGASISLLRIIREIETLKKYDIHILLTSTKGPIHDLLVNCDAKIYPLNKKKSLSFVGKLLDRIIYFPQYIFRLSQIHPDVVYANSLMNIGEVILSRIFNFYTLVHAHEGQNFIRKYSIFVKLADYFTCEYITVSQYALKSLNLYTQKNTNKHVVYNGIKITKEQTLLVLDNKPKRLSVIGTIDKNKSQLTAIQALNYLLSSTSLEFQLNFYGKIADPNYYDELLDYIHSKNLSNNITFHGEIEDQSKMYDQTDFLLITSKDETFSLTALEAFNHRIPVIASNVGGLPEVIEHNLTGLLFTSGNSTELANHIIYLINNHHIVNQLIFNAREKAKQCFDIAINAKKICSIIDRVNQHVE